MYSLLYLPVDLLRHTFQFLRMQCLAHLDSAVCELQTRKFFLTSLSGHTTEYEKLYHWPSLKWMNRRELKLRNFTVDSKVKKVEKIRETSSIFSGLVDLDIITSAGRECLCELFNVISNSSLRSLRICRRGSDPSSHWAENDLHLLFAKQNTLQKVTLCEEEDLLSDHTLAQIGQHCLMLQELRVACELAQYDNAVVTQLLSRCKSLTVLSLHGQSVRDDTLCLIAVHCRQLQTLHVSHSPSITDVGLIAVEKHCSQLTALDIIGCSGVTAKGVVLCGEYCTQLTSFSAFFCNAEDCIVSFFAQVKNITHFSGVVQNVHSCTRYWRSMVTLQLHSSNLNDAAIYGIVRHCRALMVLRVNRNTLLTDASLFLVALNLPHIECLAVDGCTGIGDDGIEALAQNCKSLRCFTIGHNDNITGRSVRKLALLCRHLDILRVNPPCAKISNEDWDWLETLP